MNPKDSLTDEAVRCFGLTSNPLEAGYILEDGRMLDFSGRHEDSGAPAKGDPFKDKRYTDHRAVESFSDSVSVTMSDFMSITGAVRLGFDRFASFVNPLTAEQLALLQGLFQDGSSVALIEVWDRTGNLKARRSIEVGDDAGAVFSQLSEACGHGGPIGACVLVRARDDSPREGLIAPLDRPAEKGEIVISRTADPAVLDRLGGASAVIVEVGSSTCHLALVLRERGVPMLRVPTALDQFRIGDRVVIDLMNEQVMPAEADPSSESMEMP